MASIINSAYPSLSSLGLLKDTEIDKEQQPSNPSFESSTIPDPSKTAKAAEVEPMKVPPGYVLNMPLNPIFNRDFSSFKRILELSKVFLSSSAAKVKTGAILQLHLSVALGALGTTPIIAAGTGFVSFHILKSSLKNLTDSSSQILQKVIDVAKGTLAAYGLTSSLAVLSGYLPTSFIPGFLSASGAFYPTFGAGVLTFVSTQIGDWALSAVLGLVALSLVQTILFSGINEIGQGIAKVWAGWNEDKKFESVYDELSFKSQEEYQEILAAEMGFESFKALVESGVLKPFIKKGEEIANPENAFRPLLAMLIVTRRELYGSEEISQDVGEIGKYQKLVAENKLQAAQELLKGTIIPKIFYYTFIKHCILEPTRADLGIIKNSPDGKMVYESYVSQLTKKAEVFNLTAIDIQDIFIEAARILETETDLQKHAYLNAILEQIGIRKLMEEQAQSSPSKLPSEIKV